MSTKTYPGTSYLETLTFKDEAGEVYDPDTITVEFITPTGTVEDTLTETDLTRTSEGVYELEWLLPSTAVKGTWIRRVTPETDDGKVWVSEEPFNVSTQPYGTLSIVKRLCNLSETTAQDTTLMGYLDDATDWLNTALKTAGETALPLDPVPPEIHRITSYFTAGRFLQRDTADSRHPYVEDAKTELKTYLEANYPLATKPLRPAKIFTRRLSDYDEATLL